MARVLLYQGNSPLARRVFRQFVAESTVSRQIRRHLYERMGATMIDSAFSASMAHEFRAQHVYATGSPIRILAVDDDEGVRRFVSRVLEEAGYAVTAAADGPHAIQIAEQAQPFDLLLADLRMPQMGGDEMARILRSSEPDLKVLYLTGYADQLFQEKPTLWNGEAFLEKPCTVAGLLEAVALLRDGHVRPPTRVRDPFGLFRTLLKH